MYYGFLAFFGLVGVALGMGGVHILPLQKRQSLMEKKMLDGTWGDYVREREMRNAIIAGAGGEPLQDYSNTLYDCQICLGTPKSGMSQMCFRVIPDTGSANLWVPSYRCGGPTAPPPTQNPCPSYCRPGGTICQVASSLCQKGCCSSKGEQRDQNPCTGKNKYNPNNSSTYVADGRTWQITYGTGSAKGILDSDIVSFSGTSLKDRVIFGEATSIAQFFAGQPLDGIMGLAFQSLAVDHITPPFIKMLNDGLLQMPVFTFWMTDLSGTPTGQNGGQITWGGYDTTHCNMQSSGAGVTWIGLTSATYFQFTLSGVSAGSYSSSQGQQAILDTGTSLIAAPQSLFSGIGAALKGQYNSNYGVAGQGLCYLGFQPFSSFGGPSVILGDVFIRQYCSVFDVRNNRIGLASATQ